MASGMMDPRERYHDLDESLRRIIEGERTHWWTSGPTQIVSHNPQQQTVVVQPTTKLMHVAADGTQTWLQQPQVHDAPVYYPSGGGVTITLPVAKGDEGLAVYASRSIDKWWQQGGPQEQTEARMQNISDAFIFPGFRSQPNVLPNVSQSTMQIRTQDGKTNFDFNPGGGGSMTMTAPNNPTSVNGKGFNTNTESNTLKASQSNTLDSPLTHHTGDVKAQGKVDASQGFYINGQPLGGGGGGGGGGLLFITLTGDVTGTGGPAVPTTVVGLQSHPVSSSAPAAGQFLGFDGTRWTPSTVPGGGGGGASSIIYVSTTPPSSPVVGSLWFDAIGGQTYVWYDDGSSHQWVVANSAVVGPTGAPGPPGPQGPPGTGGGGGGIPDAPADHLGYGRQDNAWTQVLMTHNDTLDGGNF